MVDQNFFFKYVNLKRLNFLLWAIKLLVLILYEGNVNSQLSTALKYKVLENWFMALTASNHCGEPHAGSADLHSFWGFGKQATWDATLTRAGKIPFLDYSVPGLQDLKDADVRAMSVPALIMKSRSCFSLPGYWAFLATPPKPYFVELNLYWPLSLRHVETSGCSYLEKEKLQKIKVYIPTVHNSGLSCWDILSWPDAESEAISIACEANVPEIGISWSSSWPHIRAEGCPLIALVFPSLLPFFMLLPLPRKWYAAALNSYSLPFLWLPSSWRH